MDIARAVEKGGEDLAKAIEEVITGDGGPAAQSGRLKSGGGGQKDGRDLVADQSGDGADRLGPQGRFVPTGGGAALLSQPLERCLALRPVVGGDHVFEREPAGMESL